MTKFKLGGGPAQLAVTSSLPAPVPAQTARTTEAWWSLAGHCGDAAAILAHNDEFTRLQVPLDHFCHHPIGDANANPPGLKLLFRAENPDEPRCDVTSAGAATPLLCLTRIRSWLSGLTLLSLPIASL